MGTFPGRKVPDVLSRKPFREKIINKGGFESMKKHLKSVVSFVVALGVTLSSAASMAASYSDVPNDANYAEAVASLSSIGILTGYEEGVFKPDANITRAEVATVVVRALAQEEAAKSSQGATAFTDVAADHWASGYINVASSGNNAFINGMGDGTFAPDANVTYAQVIKMLVAGIGYGDWGVSYGGYPTGYITAAKNLGITDGVSTVNGDEAATRGTVAQLTYNAINTPLLALETYSPTNPEYIILDGTNDRDYETTLTYYHNIYTVEGRVTETNQSSGGAMDADKVKFQIENTKNYGEDSIVIKRADGDYMVEDMYIGETDADDYLNVYAKALVYVDDSEDATLLSVVASTKNESIELDVKGYDDEENGDESYAEMTKNDGKNEIWFYADGSKKGKSTRYYLAGNDDKDVAQFRMYVNGVEVEVDEDSVDTYIFNNDLGKITLVDTPAEGEVSTDGKYDAIFVSYYLTGTVDSVSSDKIYFDITETNMPTSVEFDWDDEEASYSFMMDGQEIKYEDIKEGDVVSIGYDVTTDLKKSNFYNVLVSRNVVEGKLLELNDEDGEIGVGDEMYSLIDGITGTKESNDSWKMGDFDDKLGTSYTLYLDAFNRVVDYEKVASTVKYGIVHRAWDDDNADERKVTLYDTNATAKTLIVDEDMSDDEWEDLKNLSYDNNVDVQNRVVDYETNSKGELKEYTLLSAKEAIKQEYKEKSNKIGNLAIGESTVIISKDLEETKGYDLVSESALLDGSDYTAYGYDKDNGEYPFIVITEGIGDYTADTRFAVVEKVTVGTDENEDECNKISLYTAGSKDLQVINTEEKGLDVIVSEYEVEDKDTGDVEVETDTIDVSELQKGDVIIYKTDAAGDITDITLLFSVENDYDESMRYDESTWNVGFVPEAWTDPEDEIEFITGPVIDKDSDSISIIRDKDINDEGWVQIDSVEEIDYADDVAVYVYDFNNSKSERLSVGSTSSVVKASIPKTAKTGYDEDDDEDYLDMSLVDSEEINFTTVVVKTVEEEITDMLVIIPKDID